MIDEAMASLHDMLAQVAALFPDQGRWRTLLRAVNEPPPAGWTARGLQSPSPDVAEANTTSSLPRNQLDAACWCCDRRRGTGVGGLCEHCEALYETRPARTAAGSCDCGHAPGGNLIYAYDNGHRARTFCGPDCVAAHWREMFAFFLGRR